MRIIAGWKTKLGNILIAISGGLSIASVWLPEIPDRAIAGVLILGVAIAFYGAYNRFCRVFYGLDRNGNPNMRRTKIKQKRTPAGGGM